MRIYTRTGDDGTTGIWGAGREEKSGQRFEAIGALDELNCLIGLSLAAGITGPVGDILHTAQNLLFDIGAEVAREEPAPSAVGDDFIEALERSMDEMTADLAPLRNFILPGGTEAACRLHMARTVCRRAEREVLRWHTHQNVAEKTRVYLNRLSDWLFVAARWTNHTAGAPDVIWEKQEGSHR